MKTIPLPQQLGRISAFCVALCLASIANSSYAKDAAMLLGLSKTDHTLSLIDPDTLKIVDKLPVGPDPHEVVISDDGSLAFVSNTGSGAFHEVNVLDLKHRTVLPSIDTTPLLGPHGLAFANGRLWFTAQGSKAIGRIDPASGRVEWAMGTGQDGTHMIHVTPDGQHVYATNVYSGTISSLSHVLVPPPVTPMGYVLPGAKPRMDWRQTLISGRKGNEGFAVSPDGRELWTATPVDGSVLVVDLTTSKVAATVRTTANGANRLAFTPDGGTVLLSSLRNGSLLFLDAHSRRVVARLGLGHGCAHIQITPDGQRAFVSCTVDGYVAVVDIPHRKVLSQLDIGGRPDGLAWVGEH